MNKDELARNIVDAALGVMDGYEAITLAYEETMYEQLCNDIKDAVLKQLVGVVTRQSALEAIGYVDRSNAPGRAREAKDMLENVL